MIKSNAFYFVLSFSILSAQDKLYHVNGEIYEGEFQGIQGNKIVFDAGFITFRTPTIVKAITDKEGNPLIRPSQLDSLIYRYKTETLKLDVKALEVDKPKSKKNLMKQINLLVKKGTIKIWMRPTYIDVANADIHLLDKILQKSNVTLGHADFNISSERVSLDLPMSLAFQAAIDYHFKDRWNLYGDIFWTSTSTTINGTFEAPGATTTTSYLNGVYLWEGDFRFPDRRILYIVNDKHASGYSPIKWYGSTDFGFIDGTISGVYTLLSSNELGLKFSIGLDYLAMRQTLHRSIKMQAYVYEPDFDGDFQLDDYDGDGVIEYFQNDITLESDNRIEIDRSFGPVIGLTGRYANKKWTARGSLSQAWVGTNGNIKGSFRDIDNMKWINPADETVEAFLIVSSRSPYKEDVTVIVPLMKTQIDLSYQVWKNWFLGVGLYHSHSRGMPAVPTFSYRDGTWKTHTNDLSFTGITLTISYQ